MIDGLFKGLDKFLTFICMFFMSAMTVLVILSVFLRYFFNITYVWSEELITMLFVGASFLGCTIAVKQKEHIVVDFVFEALSPFAARMFRSFISLCNIFVMVVLIDAAINWIYMAGNTPTAGMRLPTYIFYSMLPISFGGIILYELMSIKGNLFSKKGGDIKNEHGSPVS